MRGEKIQVTQAPDMVGGIEADVDVRLAKELGVSRRHLNRLKASGDPRALHSKLGEAEREVLSQLLGLAARSLLVTRRTRNREVLRAVRAYAGAVLKLHDQANG